MFALRKKSNFTSTASKKSGERGIRSAWILQTIALGQLRLQGLVATYLAFFRLLVVLAGCLGVFGNHLSTVSAHPHHSLLIALPWRREDFSGRLACQKNADDGHGTMSGGEAASYSRFSSDLQSGDSITTQQRNCRERATQNGHRISPELEFGDEAVSGTKLRRTGLDALLEAAAAGRFSVLYFYSLSRLARESVITMPTLKRLVYVDKVRVISVTEGLDSERDGWELIAAILSIQHERFITDLSHNVFRGQEGAVLDGYSVGDYCFGYTSVPAPDGQQTGRGRNAKPRMVYAIEMETAQWVDRIFHWFVHEEQPIRWIARELTRLKAPKDHRATTPGWHHQYVAKLLANPKYIGRWPWGRRKNVRNPLTGQVRQEDRPIEQQDKWRRHFPHLQLIDDDTFQRAQDQLTENAEKYAKNRKSDGTFHRGSDSNGHPRHLLSGLIECGECKATFHVGGANGKYLFCPGYRHGTCRCQTQLRRDRAERMILDEIGKYILEDSEWRQAVLDAAKAAWSSQQSRLPSELEAAEHHLATIDRKISSLVDRIENGDQAPEISQRLKLRRQERCDLMQKVGKLRQEFQYQGPAPTIEWIDEQLRQLGDILNTSTPAANETLKKLVGGRIVVQEIRREGRQRHHLRGHFHMGCESMRGTIAGSLCESPSPDPMPTEAVRDISIDFVETDELGEQANRAKVLFDQGLMCAEIARQLGCGRSYVTKLIKHWHESRDLPVPDGRKRRSQLHQKHLSPPIYQEIADKVKTLADTDLTFGEIAERLGVDRNTVTKAWIFWHESRSLPAPDGRERRKSLNRKTSPPQNPPDSEGEPPAI